MNDPSTLRAVDLLTRLSNAFGPPGAEEEVRKIFREELTGWAHTSDRLGSVLATRPTEQSGPRLLVCGHLDEVGFMVRAVSPEGFISFVPLGGWWTHSLLAQRVIIRTASGARIPGVVCSTPPHLLSGDQKNQVLPIDKLHIDVGAESAEHAARMGIGVGDPIAPDVQLTHMNDPSLLLGKAFDNRVGMALAIETGKQLAEAVLPCTLLIGGTTQEEVGTRGARTLSALARPDVALVLEAPPADDTPGMPRSTAQGIIGKGVQIRVMDPTAIMNRALVAWVTDTAKANGIPHQITVRHSGGTDAASMQYHDQGIPCIVIGVPVRYIHTHHSMLHLADYHAALALLLALARSLSPAIAASFISF